MSATDTTAAAVCTGDVLFGGSTRGNSKAAINVVYVAATESDETTFETPNVSEGFDVNLDEQGRRGSRNPVKQGPNVLIQAREFTKQLTTWDPFALSASFVKPSILLASPSTKTELETAMRRNLSNALKAAVLSLPESFTLFDLLSTIVELADCNLRRNIMQPSVLCGGGRNAKQSVVATQWPYLSRMYVPLLQPLLALARKDTAVSQGMLREVASAESQLLERLELVPSHAKLAQAARSMLMDRIGALDSNATFATSESNRKWSIESLVQKSAQHILTTKITVPAAMRQSIFEAVPNRVQHLANKASLHIRFGRLFSPLEVMRRERHLRNKWGHPRPFDAPAVARALRELRRQTAANQRNLAATAQLSPHSLPAIRRLLKQR